MGVGGKHTHTQKETEREREREREEECFKQCIEELLLEVLYVLNVFYTHILLSYILPLSLYSYSVTSSDNLSAQIFNDFFPFQSGADDADHAGGVCVKGRPRGVQPRVSLLVVGREKWKDFFFEALSFSSVYFPGCLRKKHHGKFFPHLAMPTRHKTFTVFSTCHARLLMGTYIFYA